MHKILHPAMLAAALAFGAHQAVAIELSGGLSAGAEVGVGTTGTTAAGSGDATVTAQAGGGVSGGGTSGAAAQDGGAAAAVAAGGDAKAGASGALSAGATGTSGSLAATTAAGANAEAGVEAAADLDQWLSLVGHKIVSADGAAVGKIVEVQGGTGGQPVQLVASVGGFLGIGAEKVAIPVEAVVSAEQEVQVSMDEAEIKALAGAEVGAEASAAVAD